MMTEIPDEHRTFWEDKLNNWKEEIVENIVGQVTFDDIVQGFFVEFKKKPFLRDAEVDTVRESLKKVARLGFRPGSDLGYVYLASEEKQDGTIICKPILGYKGMIKLARRTGEIKVVDAGAVHANDDFEFQRGLDPVLNHTYEPKERGELVYAWALARYSDGESQFTVLTQEEIETIKEDSGIVGEDGSPWDKFEDEMWKKTAVRSLCKYLPLDDQARELITEFDQSEFDFDNKKQVQNESGSTSEKASNALEKARETISNNSDNNKEDADNDYNDDTNSNSDDNDDSVPAAIKSDQSNEALFDTVVAEAKKLLNNTTLDYTPPEEWDEYEVGEALIRHTLDEEDSSIDNRETLAATLLYVQGVMNNEYDLKQTDTGALDITGPIPS